jgi:filamentous hemagglutinin family protein
MASVTLFAFIFQGVVFAADQLPAVGSTAIVYTSANGVPVVNIAAPNAAGLSHNRYETFNVPTQGTVLNNATNISGSVLAGFIRENPNLNGKSASIILNEVTSTQRSVLQGYLEVHGPQAQVIVANPNGITCNGCGFINTPRATLTTGVPGVDGNGNLTGFGVSQGDILINGTGADASGAGYFDLVARSVNVQGPVSAQGLQLVTGLNQYDYATRTVTGSTTGSGAVPSYAIDSSALGGMYANRIRLIATENGVGVRLLGEAAATVDDLTLTAAGNIQLQGKLYAARDISTTGAGITSGGNASSYVYAERNVTLDAGTNGLTHGAGLLYAGNDMTLTGTTLDVGGSTSQLYSTRDLTLNAAGALSLGAGEIIAERNLLLSGFSITDTSGAADVRSAGNDLTLTSPGNILLDHGQVYDAGHKLQINANDIEIGGAIATTLTGGYNSGGSIVLNAANDVTIRGNGSVQSSGDVIFNAGRNLYLNQNSDVLAYNNFTANNYTDANFSGKLVVGGDINLRPNSAAGNVTTLVTSTGSVKGYGLFSLRGNGATPETDTTLQIVAGDQSANHGRILADSFDLHANTLRLGSTDATHYGLLQGGFNGGNIVLNNLTLDGAYAKLIANTNVGNAATTTLTLNNNLSNPGFIYAYGNLNLNVSGNIDNLGGAAISSGFGDLTINMTGSNKRFDNRANATLYAGNDLSVLYPHAGIFYNHATGTAAGLYGIVQSGNITTLGSTCDPLGITAPACVQGVNAVTLTNEGRIESDGDIRIIAETFNNNVPYTTAWGGYVANGKIYSSPNGESGRYSGTHSQNYSGAAPNPPGHLTNGGAYYVLADGRIYEDFTAFWNRDQYYVGGLPSFRPRMAAGGTLHISTWAGNNSGGTLEGNTVKIDSIEPAKNGSAFLNAAINLTAQVWTSTGRSVWRCYDATFDTALDTCLGNLNKVYQGDAYPNGASDTNKVLFNTIQQPVDIAATISAGTFSSSIGTLTNSASTGAPTITPKTTGYIPPGSPTLPTLPTLPTSPNGLYVISSTPGSHYLVESNPLYASSQNPYLGSDYLVKELGLDPDKVLLRLGDANYENRLIKDQIQQQVGVSLLRSASSDYDQQKLLMDNAVLEAKEQKLSFGVALTSAQVASLKHDIVWMVERVVQGKKVLTPVVYLTDATRAQTASGATILADTAIITGDSFLNKGGTVSGADKLVIMTRKDIVNSSGTLMGGTVALKSLEGDIINKTETFRVGDTKNYTTNAGKTGGIYASNELYLDAGRDVKIEGATVNSEGSTNIKAGRDVSITSLVLESRSTIYKAENTDISSRTSETQETKQQALTAFVGGKGDTTIVAGRDVNLTGASVYSETGDTTLISKEGNVNIKTLELKYSKTEKTESTGLFIDSSADAKTTSAGTFTGVDNSKSQTDSKGTTNVGSNIQGKGVNIIAKKGDVNIKGSTVEAGENGIYVDAAKNVSITAAADTFSSTTKGESNRVGAFAEANADGAFTGLRYERSASGSTYAESNAVTNGLKSGGDITLIAGNKLTNEGTSFNAANDIYVSALEVENKAARNTVTQTAYSEGDKYSAGQGVTTNGMGQSVANQATGKGGTVVIASPEAQARVGGGSERSSSSSGSSDAVTTQFKAGGNVVMDVKGKMVDEGTQYDAGKSIQISANSYENKAAANTTYSKSESLTAGGQITAGVNTASEVTGTVGGYGSNSKDSKTSSTAVVGGFKAGENVVIRTEGDTTLEGTNIKAGKDVGLIAGGNLTYKQANNTTSKTGSSETSSANLSASACVDLTCASGGGGADGRTANQTGTSSKGVAGSINAGGNVILKSGGDMTLQGTNLTSGKDTVLDAGKNFEYKALKSTSTLVGQADGGGAQLGLGVGNTAQVTKSGSVNVTGSFERGRDDANSTTKSGGTVNTGGTFVLKSGNDAHLEGTKITASDAVVDVKGNFKMESAQSKENQDSYSTKGTVGVGGSRGGGAMGASGASGSGGSGGSSGNALGGGADVDVDIHKKDNLTNQNASIKTTGGTSLNVGGNATLAGARIDAQGGVSGEIKGNLNIESRTDRVKQEDTVVKTYVGVAPTGGKSETKQAKGLTAASHAGETGLDIDVNSSKKDNVTLSEASGISGGAGGLKNLTVGGNVSLKGASEEILGANIKGSITKTTVETRKDESSIDFRVPLSVAAATGQEPGKAAQVNGTLVKGSGGARKPGGAEGENMVRPPAKTGGSEDGVNVVRSSVNNRGGSEDNQPAPRKPTLIASLGDQDGAPGKPVAERQTRPLGPDYQNVEGNNSTRRPTPTGNGGYQNADDNGSNNVQRPARPLGPDYQNKDVNNSNNAKRPIQSLGEDYQNKSDSNIKRPPSLGEDYQNKVDSNTKPPLVTQTGGEDYQNNKGNNQNNLDRQSQNGGSDYQNGKGNNNPGNVRSPVQPSGNDSAPPKQQILMSEKGFKMKTLYADFEGESQGTSTFWKSKKIEYLDTEEKRVAREVEVKDGLIVHKQTGKPFDTGDKESGAIFVMDGQGRIFATTEQKIGEFHHSSLANGEPTAMSGHMLVKGGKLVHIDNNSGHYKPDLDQLNQMRGYLSEQGVDLSNVKNVGVANVVVGHNDHRIKWVDSNTGEVLPEGKAPPAYVFEKMFSTPDQNQGTGRDSQNTTSTRRLTQAENADDIGSNNVQRPARPLGPDYQNKDVNNSNNAKRPIQSLVEDYQNKSDSSIKRPLSLGEDYQNKSDSNIKRPPSLGEDYQNKSDSNIKRPLLTQTGGEDFPNANPRSRSSSNATDEFQVSSQGQRPRSSSTTPRDIYSEVDVGSGTGGRPNKGDSDNKVLYPLVSGKIDSLEAPPRVVDSAPLTPVIQPPKQKEFISEKGFKMKTLDSDFEGEDKGKGKWWNNSSVTIKYLSADERNLREVEVKNGLIVEKVSGELFDTGSNKEGAIFVMDGQGRIYATTEQRSAYFHHSSLLGGEPVAMAGHMFVQDGKLVHINNQSGHYKPDLGQLKQMRGYLAEQGVDLTNVKNVGVTLVVGEKKITPKWVNTDTGELVTGNPMHEAFYQLHPPKEQNIVEVVGEVTRPRSYSIPKVGYFEEGGEQRSRSSSSVIDESRSIMDLYAQPNTDENQPGTPESKYFQ